LEGQPGERYTVTWQPVSQQLNFRQSGTSGQGTLFYEARLGGQLPLPPWISFDPSTQIVTAIPNDDVEPGVYVVRVIARDATGREAEATLTIHVLRDNAEARETLGANVWSRARSVDRVTGQPDGSRYEPGNAPANAAQPQQESEPQPSEERSAREGASLPVMRTEHIRQSEADELELPQELRDMIADVQAGQTLDGIILPEESREPADRAETNVNSLTRTLLYSGATGQMIEAARFLEALAADTRPEH
jgi:hypothetical protein